MSPSAREELAQLPPFIQPGFYGESIEDRVGFAERQLELVTMFLRMNADVHAFELNNTHVVGLAEWLEEVRAAIAPISDAPGPIANWKPSERTVDEPFDWQEAKQGLTALRAAIADRGVNIATATQRQRLVNFIDRAAKSLTMKLGPVDALENHRPPAPAR